MFFLSLLSFLVVVYNLKLYVSFGFGFLLIYSVVYRGFS